MCGACGKPRATVARGSHWPSHRVHCTKLQNKKHVTEALHRAQFKFPPAGRSMSQRRGASRQVNADEFEDMVAEKWLVPDTCGVKYICPHIYFQFYSPGPLVGPKFLRVSECSSVPDQIILGNESHIQSERLKPHTHKLKIYLNF